MSDELEKKYYRIREVAEILNIQPSTLRFWESRFSLIKPYRNDRGTRFYTAADIEKIRMVYFLVKEKGLKLEAAEEQLRQNRTGVSRHHKAVEHLKAIRSELQKMIDALDSLR